MSQDIECDLITLLQDVARLSRVQADKRARVHGMTSAHWVLLLRLEQNSGLSQKEVADLLEVEPNSVARLVDRLEAGGLIERRPDASDRRIWRLHLLPAAVAALDKIGVQRTELAELIGGNVAKPLRDTMLQGLMQLKSNLLRAPEPAPDQKIGETA